MNGDGEAGDVGGVDDVEEDAVDTACGISGVRDVIVTVDAVDSSVAVLCDGAPYAKPSCSTCSRSGRLLDTAICGPWLDCGVGGGTSRSWRSIRRSTKSEALLKDTDGSTGRMKREVNKRSEGPMG